MLTRPSDLVVMPGIENNAYAPSSTNHIDLIMAGICAAMFVCIPFNRIRSWSTVCLAGMLDTPLHLIKWLSHRL
jgi:hypothetical protein